MIVDENKIILSDIQSVWELDMFPINRIKKNETALNETKYSVIKEFDNNMIYMDKRWNNQITVVNE